MSYYGLSLQCFAALQRGLYKQDNDVIENDVTTNRPTTTTITVKLKMHETQEDSTKHE